MRQVSPDEIVAELTARMFDLGIYVYHRALGSSRYLKFSDPKMGSIRVADHRQRERYNYTWNVWLDEVERPFRSIRKGIPVFHVGAEEEDLDQLEEAIRTRYRRLKTGVGSRYEGWPTLNTDARG